MGRFLNLHLSTFKYNPYKSWLKCNNYGIDFETDEICLHYVWHLYILLSILGKIEL